MSFYFVSSGIPALGFGISGLRAATSDALGRLHNAIATFSHPEVDSYHVDLWQNRRDSWQLRLLLTCNHSLRMSMETTG